MKSNSRKSWLEKLVDVVARLRGPNGCPWDRKQTHLSLIKHLKEEALEVEVALRRGKPYEIEDELGDLLLQVLLHSEIAKDEGQFDIEDVAKSQFLKLKRRHPHVFGNRRFKTAEEVLLHWDVIKKAERKLRKSDVARRNQSS